MNWIIMKRTLLTSILLASTAIFSAPQAPEELDAKSRAAAQAAPVAPPLPRTGAELYAYLRSHNDPNDADKVITQVDALDVDEHGSRTHQIINWHNAALDKTILHRVIEKCAISNDYSQKPFRALLRAGINVQKTETQSPLQVAMWLAAPDKPHTLLIACALINAGATVSSDIEWMISGGVDMLSLIVEASKENPEDTLKHVHSYALPAEHPVTERLHGETNEILLAGNGNLSYKSVNQTLFIKHFSNEGLKRRKQRALNIEAQNAEVISALDSCITVPGLLAIINKYIPPRYTLAAPPEKLLHVGGPLTEEEAKEEQENKQRQTALIASTKTASQIPNS
jgi:hypothetical protein